jgi:hypothetical protein
MAFARSTKDCQIILSPRLIPIQQSRRWSQETDGFALSPLDSALQAQSSKRTVLGLVEPAGDRAFTLASLAGRAGSD